MQLTGPIYRIALLIALSTVVATAQSRHSTHRKSDTDAPATGAKVIFAGGQLTVVASDNSLAETLAQIRTLTNARVEGPQPKLEDRVSGEFGPDSPRAVLSEMLATSHYNFVLVSAPGNPGSVQRIVLSEPTPESIAIESRGTTPSATPAQRAEIPQKSSAQIAEELDRLVEKDTTNNSEQVEDSTLEKGQPVPNSEESMRDAKPDTSPRPAQPPRQASSDLPTVPTTVEVCGVTYDASQLVNLKVPDHCDQKGQQPTTPNKLK